MDSEKNMDMRFQCPFSSPKQAGLFSLKKLYWTSHCTVVFLLTFVLFHCLWGKVKIALIR